MARFWQLRRQTSLAAQHLPILALAPSYIIPLPLTDSVIDTADWVAGAGNAVAARAEAGAGRQGLRVTQVGVPTLLVACFLVQVG